ncbi:MAG: GNAT family N-acetyltransferase [Chloroflexota bacterium]|nr:MAG: N-acetyltransferase [Chloroflexota bacterium]
MLTGTLVNLRAVEQDDYENLHRWVNGSEGMLYWGRPGNTESMWDVAERERREASRGNSRKYIIETNDGVPIGQIDYYDLDWPSRSAWTSILIGESGYWGGGYGTDAMRTLLRYLFLQLDLHRVALNVHETNERAQRSYEKNGFVREGVLRDWAFFNGEWVDGVVMSVLDRDFRLLDR